MLTSLQILAIVALLNAFGVSSSTVATVQGDLTAQTATSTPDVTVSQTQVVTPPVSVNFGGEATTSPVDEATSSEQAIAPAPVCDDTPIVAYQPWVIENGVNSKVSQNPTLNYSDGDLLVFSVTVSSCLSEVWTVTTEYPYINHLTGSIGYASRTDSPSNSLDFNDRLGGGFNVGAFGQPIGNYTAYIVASDGTTVATTTVPITVQ